MPADNDRRARDRVAEIDLAIAILTRAVGPVSVRAGTDGERQLRFVHSEDVAEQETAWMPFTGALGARAVSGDRLTVGLGPHSQSTVETARRAAASVGPQLSAGTIGVTLPPGRPELVGPLIDGLGTSFDGDQPVQLLVDPSSVRAARLGILAADTVRLVRRLVSAPANVLTPERAANWASDIAAHSGLECTVLGPEEIGREGFGGLEAIGSGSSNGPRLVRLTHRGSASGPVVSLVGKGITFDSGGLSLKSPAAMQNMRMDMAGAATALAVMGALQRGRCPITVHAVLPFAENLPGPGAVRPGDVVTSWNGTQIQVLDTDFEGRVVLADALALAAADQPDLLIDLATLTYQAEVALGPEIAAVLARDDAAAQQLLAAAAQTGEPMWQLPWAPRYIDQVRTPFGVRNHPLRDSGRALTAALFLGEFVPESVPWVHCDMTGPAWAGTASEDGATGFGARTLLQLLLNPLQ